jgi:hypothetical protein
MKTFLLILCLLNLTLTSLSQEFAKSQSCQINPEVPNYAGGYDKMVSFIYDNLKDSLKRKGISAALEA